MSKEITLEALLARIESLEEENKKLKSEKSQVQGGEDSPYPVNVDIGCNLIQGTNLSSPNGDVDSKITYNETIRLPASDVVQVLKSGENRNMFINGFLYFLDDSCYERFGIKRKHNINREVIKGIVLKNNVKKLEEFFNDKTRKKMDGTMVHTIFYTIVDLNVSGELDGMLYETREFIQNYFSMDIQTASKLYKDFQNFLV